MALRGIALCAASNGDKEEARRLLLKAVDRASGTSDTWRWAVGCVLTDLVEIEQGSVPEHLARARQIASTGPMPDLVERLQKFS